MQNKEISNLILKYPLLNIKMINKDIYLSEIMEYIFNIFDKEFWRNNYFLCGGTSLSKCYRTTNRLSEDIDISIFGYTQEKSKKTIKKIAELIDIAEKDNKIKIIKRDNFWSTKRTFLSCKFKYKDHEFSFDVKAIKAKLDKSHISKKEVYDIRQKNSKIEHHSTILIPVVDISFIVAEKLLVFHKKFKKQTLNPIDNDKINNDYEVYRLFRHVYDVFMIFNKLLIIQNDESFLIINKWFVEISDHEKDFNTPINKINVLQDNFFDYNEKVLKKICETECYEKVKINDIISFYKTISKKINILFNPNSM